MNAMPEPFLYDPFTDDVMSNPIPYYKVLRERYPVYYIDRYDTYFFSRFEDVQDILSKGDNTFLSSETALPTPEYLLTHRNAAAPPMASTDPMAPGPTLASPFYEEMRAAHLAPLRPTSVAKLQGFVRGLARERLDVLLPRGKFDLTSEYGGIVAASVTCHLFGLPLSLAEKILNTVNEISRYNPIKKAIDVSSFFVELKQYIVPAIEARRAADADGGNLLIDGLINYRTRPDGRALGNEEIADQLVCVAVGNTESAPKVTAHGILELSQRPDQLTAVRADLDKNVPIAVNEMVRFCAPVQYFFRTAHKDVSIAGQPIKAGQRVAGLLYSASRDEREYDDPEAFIWNRPMGRTLAFGSGLHHCIGKHMALLEVGTLVHEFLSRVHSFHFAIDQAVRNPSYFQWGWNKLPVVVTG